MIFERFSDNINILFSFMVLMVAAVYTLFLDKMPGMTPLDIKAWLIVLVAAVINILMIEIVKFYFNKNKNVKIS